jgi:TetR/AcrR family transcriptional regulator, regulator of autoinduction and epiphytic fitness
MTTNTGSWLQPPNADSTRQERRRGRKVNEIMTLTARMIAERGYHSTNIEEIAEQLDLSKASIYHYFNGKDALVMATLESCADYVSRELAELAAQDASATVRLAMLIRRQLSIISAESVEISRLFLHPLDWPPSIAQQVRVWQREHGLIFRSVIDEGVASGEFVCVNSRIANMAIQGTMGLFPLWFSGNRTEQSATVALEDVVKTVMLVVGVDEVPPPPASAPED